MPIVKSPRAKIALVNEFRAVWKSAPNFLTTLDYDTLKRQASTSGRSVRQNLFFSSNYHHIVMIIQAFEDVELGVECNVRGSLEAAHEALWSFFKMNDFFESDAIVWWVFQHRAFEEAVSTTIISGFETRN